MLEDTKDTVGWDLVTLRELPESPAGSSSSVVMEQCDPEVVIMSSRAQDAMVDKVEEYCKFRLRLLHDPPQRLIPGQQNQRICELQHFKSFVLTYAIPRLSNLSVGGDFVAIQVDEEVAATSSTGDTDSLGYVDRFAKYRPDNTAYAGMGKVRLNMVKLGCWTNVDAPLAVSWRNFTCRAQARCAQWVVYWPTWAKANRASSSKTRGYTWRASRVCSCTSAD